jgi:hypothetical protein
MGDKSAYPVLDYDKMSAANNFDTVYHLEEILVHIVGSPLFPTKKIDIAWKNVHRLFWNLSLLPMSKVEEKRFYSFLGKVQIFCNVCGQNVLSKDKCSLCRKIKIRRKEITHA